MSGISLASPGHQLGLSREAELLLLASAGEVARDRFRRLAESPIDWDQLTALAFRAQATSTLWRLLREVPGLQAGPRTARLEYLGVINEFRLGHIRKLLQDVVGLLANYQIEVMLLKGAAHLAGGTSLTLERSMNDIDLLVVKGSPEEALRLCREAHWTLLYEDGSHQYEGHHHLAPLIDPAGVGLRLEMHRALFPGGAALRIDEQAIVGRARILPLGSTTVLVPSLEDMLLYACLHFGWGHSFLSHSWSTFADAHLIVSDPAFSWQRFLEVVGATQGGSCCYWTLRLARAGTMLPVPDQVLSALPGARSGRVGMALERHFFKQLYDPAAANTPVQLRQALWQVAIRPGKTGLGGARPWLRPLPVRRPGVEQATPKPRWPRSIETLKYLYGLWAPTVRT